MHPDAQLIAAAEKLQSLVKEFDASPAPKTFAEADTADDAFRHAADELLDNLGDLIASTPQGLLAQLQAARRYAQNWDGGLNDELIQILLNIEQGLERLAANAR